MSSQRESKWFEVFMASTYGRGARVVLGLAIIAFGLLLVGGKPGLGVAALGLVPIAAGVMGLCPIAPLWGGHFFGSEYCSRRDR